MNNSIAIEEEKVTMTEPIPWLRAREGELVKIIEAIGSLSNTREWSTLKSYVFDGVLESLQKRMATEASKMPLDEKEIYKLQGQIAWAKKYSDLESLANAFRLELTNVRKQLNPPAERDMAPDTESD